MITCDISISEINKQLHFGGLPASTILGSYAHLVRSVGLCTKKMAFNLSFHSSALWGTCVTSWCAVWIAVATRVRAPRWVIFAYIFILYNIFCFTCIYHIFICNINIYIYIYFHIYIYIYYIHIHIYFFISGDQESRKIGVWKLPLQRPVLRSLEGQTRV